MLLLYLRFHSLTFSPYPIYIPLCFYFISKSRACSSVLIRFTFHYASTLSMIQYYSQKDVSLIYIPLCFYFIWVYGNAWVYGDAIYIPLCFYFIEMKAPKNLYNSLFTFHYASTLSMWMPEACPQQTAFTFHYASTLSNTVNLSECPNVIYIPLCFYFIPQPRECELYSKHNLHSTMLLLYRRTTAGLGITDFIYIPLCFYFIGGD